MKGSIMAKMKGKIISRIIDVSEFRVEFRIGPFLKFWLYHLLFFYFGFFSLLVIVPVDTIALAKNMSFWFGAKNRISLWV